MPPVRIRTLIILAIIAAVILPTLAIGALAYYYEVTENIPLRNTEVILSAWCEGHSQVEWCPLWARVAVNNHRDQVLRCMGNNRRQVSGEQVGLCMIQNRYIKPPLLWSMADE